MYIAHVFMFILFSHAGDHIHPIFLMQKSGELSEESDYD